MIKVSRINQEVFYINPTNIEIMEEIPDLIITLINGKKFVVSESADEVNQKIIEWWGSIFKASNLNKKLDESK